MAGNFWQSSHCAQWVLDKVDLARERAADMAVLSEDEYSKIMIFYCSFIQVLGEQLKLRQQVIASATVFFKRFYAMNSLNSVDPLLLAPTCVFLSSKVEEFGVISNTRLINTCSTIIKNKINYAFPSGFDFPYRANSILECEFYLLENMDCCLVVFQPYRPLVQYTQDLGPGYEETLLPLAWRIVNDSFRSDVSLLFPPFLIALACLHMASVILGKDLRNWFSELAVDMDKIQEITKHVLALYDLWKSYDEKKEIASILQKMPKPKSTPSQN